MFLLSARELLCIALNKRATGPTIYTSTLITSSGVGGKTDQRFLDKTFNR